MELAKASLYSCVEGRGSPLSSFSTASKAGWGWLVRAKRTGWFTLV